MIASDAPSSFMAVRQKTREHELTNLRSGKDGVHNLFFGLNRDKISPSSSRGSVLIENDVRSPVSA